MTHSSTPATENPRTLVVERVFPHPPEKLWRALTESPLLAQWMMNNDFAPVVGRKFQFHNEPKLRTGTASSTARCWPSTR